MRARQSQLPFVQRAKKLASALQGVERNVFLMIVADFLTDLRSKPAHLERMLELLGKDSGNHLNRSGTFGVQARIVVRQLPSILKDPGLSDVELRTVLGWTSRMLQVRSGKYDTTPGGPPQVPVGHPHQPPPNQRRPTKPLRPISRTAPPPPPPVVSRAPEPPNWKARIQGLGWGNAGRIVSDLLSELKGETRREAAKTIIESMGGKREFRAKKDQPWVQELFEAAGD